LGETDSNAVMSTGLTLEKGGGQEGRGGNKSQVRDATEGKGRGGGTRNKQGK